MTPEPDKSLEQEVLRLRAELSALKEESQRHSVAEQAYRETQARLRAAIDALPFDFWLRDKHGVCVMQNDASFRLWGNLIDNKPHSQDIPEETRQLWLNNNRRAMAGEVVSEIVEFRHQGGEGVFHNIVAPVKDGSEVIGILGVNIDITDWRAAEEALRESRERMLLAQEAADMATWEWDVATNRVERSDNAAALVGAEPGALGDTVEQYYELIYPEDRQDFMRAIEEALTPGGPGLFFTEHRITVNNSTRWLQLRGKALPSDSGRHERFVGIALEVTARKEADQALRDSLERYRALFDSASDAIFVMDGEVFVESNVATEKIFGVPSAEAMIGKPPFAYSPEVQPDGQNSREKGQTILKSVLEGHPQRFYWKHNRHDGTPFDAEVSLNKIDIPGRGLIMAIVRDITDRLHSEAILRSTVKGTSASTGNELFRSMVRQLATALDCRYCLIGILRPEEEDTVEAVAFWDTDRIGDAFQYDLAGTPCENVVGKEICVFPQDVMSQFPQDNMLKRLNVQAYMGMPLYGSDGQSIGILAVMNDRPISGRTISDGRSLLAIFGARVAAEVERMRADEKLQHYAHELEEEREKLQEKNIALREVLDHLQREKDEFRRRMTTSIDGLLTPVVENLRQSDGTLTASQIEALELGLEDLLGPDFDPSASNLSKLTARELDICERIKEGLSSKEIAQALDISPETVNKHRESIRHKLQLKHRNINLSAYLRSL